MRKRRPESETDWAQRVRDNPLDATARSKYAAMLMAAGMMDEAAEQLDACLLLCPRPSRKRLLIVVLRARVKLAARKAKLGG
jgi:protein involved in temperature-dependent protein secretion